METLPKLFTIIGLVWMGKKGMYDELDGVATNCRNNYWDLIRKE